jgi:two-component system KDP operon response regulator KdpE
MTPPSTVLIIEDEPPMQYFLRSLIEGHHMRAVLASTAQEGITQAAMHPPDVVLLDLGLPDADGLSVIERLRAWSAAPVIVLSARGRDRDKVEALDAGADDYLTKPFSAEELLARVRVALRHRLLQGAPAGPVYEAQGLRIDLARRAVSRDGRAIPLTPTEYKIVEVLVQHAGRVLTHSQILRAVWGPHQLNKAHYVRVHMHQLRAKIEREPDGPTLILTEAGVGYRLVEAP